MQYQKIMRNEDIELLAALIYRDIAAYIIDNQKKEKHYETD